MIKKLVLSMFIIITSSFAYTYWTSDDVWTIIPESSSWDKVQKAVKEFWETPWKVWENYNKKAKDMNVWDSFASWIFTWDTIFNFLKHIANLLSQIGLVIWALMIIYAWYKYSVWVFTGDASKWWKDAVKWAIYWVLIVIFSYAIMKILLWMFWWV